MEKVGFVIKDLKTGKYWKQKSNRWVKNIFKTKIYRTYNQALHSLNSGNKAKDYYIYGLFLTIYPNAKIIKIKIDISEDINNE